VSGDGPCNAQRIARRRRAHDEGAWVRDAATAHARKKALKAESNSAAAAEAGS
jgi:ring-1,2-phenylacetyl-CoA epoxidase subunit PaaA